jgi:hypothetical protein
MFYHGFTFSKVKDYEMITSNFAHMAMQKKTWMTSFLFKELLVFFKEFVPSGMSHRN